MTIKVPFTLYLAAILVVCAASLESARADTLITYKNYLDKAAYIDGAFEENLGGQSTMKNVVNAAGHAGVTAGSVTRSLLTIPNVATPDGMTFSSASLKLYCTWYNTNGATTNFSMVLHPLTHDWVEGDGTKGEGTTSGATWTTYDGQNAWGTAGGDYDSTVSAYASAAPSTYSWTTLDLTSLWSNANLHAYGALLAISPEDGTLVPAGKWITETFATDDWINDLGTDYSPRLETTYSVTGNAFSLSGTNVLSAVAVSVGNSGLGSFTQSGGTCAIDSTLHVGHSPGANGAYLLRAGQLSAASEFVGYAGTGSFAQTGGTNNAGYLFVGPSGTYVLSGGALNVTAGLDIRGTLKLTGSSTVINATASIVNLAGSVVATSSSKASISLDSNSILILSVGHVASDYFAAVTGSGTVHTAGTALEIASGSSFSCAGSIDDHLKCTGTLNASSATAAINLYGGLTVSGGSVNLGLGSLFVNDASSGMTAGSFGATNQYVGYVGTGVFYHAVGTNILSGDLFVGYDSNAKGAYMLSSTSAAKLYAANEYVGYCGSGTFNQLGGTNTITSALYLGTKTGGYGVYNLVGGVLALNAVVGGTGVGILNFAGGTLKPSSAISSSVALNFSGTAASTLDTNGRSVAFSGKTTGSGTLSKIGSGTLTLSGSNVSSGTVSLQKGALVLSSAGANVSTMNVITAAGATLSVVGDSYTLNSITGSGTTIVADSATLVVGCLVQDSLILGSSTASASATAVPEPSTLAAIVFSGAAAGFLTRKR